jgi:hypothetical protein
MVRRKAPEFACLVAHIGRDSFSYCALTLACRQSLVALPEH